jgi:heme-degrading monooxygenase HmoA
MFARVITAQAGSEGFSKLIDLAERQLPAARLRPGFHGYQFLADKDSGKLLIISYWDTHEQMKEVSRGIAGGIHDGGTESTDLISPRLETYEVKLQD